MTEIWSDQKLGVAYGSTSTSFEFRYKEFFNFFPFLSVQRLLMYGFRTIKNNNNKRIKRKYIYILVQWKRMRSLNHSTNPNIFQKKREGRCVWSRNWVSFCFCFLCFLCSLPLLSSGLWLHTLSLVFTNWINNSC